MVLRFSLPVLLVWLGALLGLASAAPKPNVLLILCDDLGYGDVRANFPAGKIPTSNIDRLAAGGLRFTDAHTPSSVCTPTRYSLLTGRYNWRSRLQSGVLGGLSPSLIEPGRLTVAGLLQQNSYHTAAIGKWHLGLDWAKAAGKAPPPTNAVETAEQHWSVDFTKPFANGPTRRGFDYFFGIAASLDMVPYSFLENDRVTVVPTLDSAFPMTYGKTNTTTRRGPTAKGFEAENVLPELTRKAVEYLGQRAAAAKAGQPFFLYLPLNSPHTPILPTAEWRGKSGISPYADFVMETDDAVRQVLAALDQHGLAENTLVIFTSDNGCSPAANIKELNAAGHLPNGPLRGAKADIWDGGHRVPFFVRWPGKVKAGAVSDQIISHVDLMATCAEIVGARLPANAGEDSVSFLPALLGTATNALREALVHHSIDGKFALRQGRWKLCLTPGSGGWGTPKDSEARGDNLPEVQLYDLESSVAEQRNLQAEQPEIVARLTRLLEQYIANGRSTPGPPQRNDAVVDLWKKANKGKAGKKS